VSLRIGSTGSSRPVPDAGYRTLTVFPNRSEPPMAMRPASL